MRRAKKIHSSLVSPSTQDASLPCLLMCPQSPDTHNDRDEGGGSGTRRHMWAVSPCRRGGAFDESEDERVRGREPQNEEERDLYRGRESTSGERAASITVSKNLEGSLSGSVDDGISTALLPGPTAPPRPYHARRGPGMRIAYGVKGPRGFNAALSPKVLSHQRVSFVFRESP